MPKYLTSAKKNLYRRVVSVLKKYPLSIAEACSSIDGISPTNVYQRMRVDPSYNDAVRAAMANTSRRAIAVYYKQALIAATEGDLKPLEFMLNRIGDRFKNDLDINVNIHGDTKSQLESALKKIQGGGNTLAERNQRAIDAVIEEDSEDSREPDDIQSLNT